jgi:hypothetical protein
VFTRQKLLNLLTLVRHYKSALIIKKFDVNFMSNKKKIKPTMFSIFVRLIITRE